MDDYDLLRGKVTGHLGEKEKGMVEVSLGGYSQDQDKLHARVAQDMSGVYWLPEIGDIVEVLVPRAPGYEAHILYIHRPEGDAQAEECWTEKNDKKQFRTRTGHTITLDDTQDKTRILLESAGGLELLLEDEPQTVTIQKKDAETPALKLNMKEDEIVLSAGKKLTVTCGGATLEIDSSGNISIQAKGKLELSGQEITLNAQSKLTAKGQQVEVSGGMTTNVTGQTQLQMSSSGITEVKGSMVKLN